MLISCTSCQSKYLVNSGDLKPHGRTVQCAKCGNKWFQDSLITDSIQPKEKNNILSNQKTTNSQEENINENKANLPSTYVKEEKVSILNSTIVVLISVLFTFGFFTFRNLDINSLVLLEFYFNEFYFNLKLIVDDIAKIIHKLIN